ncbi:unnamed protein product, partial [Polarella glacialis]
SVELRERSGQEQGQQDLARLVADSAKVPSIQKMPHRSSLTMAGNQLEEAAIAQAALRGRDPSRADGEERVPQSTLPVLSPQQLKEKRMAALPEGTQNLLQKYGVLQLPTDYAASDVRNFVNVNSLKQQSGNLS